MRFRALSRTGGGVFCENIGKGIGMIGWFGSALAFFAILVFPVPPATAQDGAAALKLEALMKESGYKSAAKVNDTTWTLDFSGKQIPKFKVAVTATDKDASGIITVIVNPVARDQLPRNRANLSAAMLKANNDFDYVKIGFDKDGDLFVRADIPPRTDLVSFKAVVEQVAAAADEFYGKIKQFLR
jgi:hypothetical protein